MNDLQRIVQNNCHISDAVYAGNYTLCIYLLKMREFYRWETQQPFGVSLSNENIGAWLTEREALWNEIENQSIASLMINDKVYDPYESKLINQQINPSGLVYSGGYGLYGKPVFFLAELERTEHLDDYTLYVSGHELARDLAAPPGMAQNKCVFIRRESLRRFIWEKYEESHWYNAENPLARALAFYDFKNQPQESLDKMTDTEIDTIIQHEIGEIMAGQLLSDEWENMVANLPHSQAEIMARAVRDHIADALSTLPELLKRDDPAQIHFYFANLSSMRKLIFPSLMSAYMEWLVDKDTSPIKKQINKAKKHWLNLAHSLMKLHKKYGNESHHHMELLIKSNYL